MRIYLVNRDNVTAKMSPLIKVHLALELFIPGTPGRSAAESW